VKRHAEPDVDLKEVLVSLAEVLRRAEMFQHHEVYLEPLSVRERMTAILDRVNSASDFVSFGELFRAEEGRRGVVVTFLALMELVRESLLDFVQNEPYAPIYVRAAGE
jgi:segregation and condensation protein A